jgi:hypothetical protein
MVVTPKANGNTRICVDLTRLHVLPLVEQALGQLGGAKVFSKLDANSPWVLAGQVGCRICSPNHVHHTVWSVLSQPPSYWNYLWTRVLSILSGIEGVVGLIDDILVCAGEESVGT